ncbi:MAG TPA: twin-arginine translocase subunit TatC [Rubrobacteraceae bacterium]|nr:twin-arginine translocase subunit TatC [Rubrobacteraceae bacterium]
MTLIEHLGELRSRIIKIGVAFLAVAVVAWFFRPEIFDFLLAPAPSLKGELNVTAPTEALITDVKLTLYTAFLFTIPVLLYQMWAFVAPAVGDVGRAFTYVLITLASSLFLAGVAFGYFVVLPLGIDFLLGWGGDRYEQIIVSDKYLAFVTRFLLAFGIVFEFPAATYVGAKLELVDAPLLKRYRRHAIVANFILAAALTPGQDPLSMILMAVPMVVMYELSIIIARYVNPVSEVSVHELGTDEDDEPEDDGEYEEDEPVYDGVQRSDDEEDETERDL